MKWIVVSPTGNHFTRTKHKTELEAWLHLFGCRGGCFKLKAFLFLVNSARKKGYAALQIAG